jgi:hypothetical protein
LKYGVSFGGLQLLFGPKKIGGPGQPARSQKPARKACPAFSHHTVDEELIGGRRRSAKGQRNRPHPQLEQAIAPARLKIILTLWDRTRDKFNLSVVQAELLVKPLALRLDGSFVGQKYALRTALDDGGRDTGVRNVGKRLSGEHDGNIFLPKYL